MKKSKVLAEYFRKIAAKGGRARAKALSPAERTRIARKAVQARWAKEKRRNNNEKGKTKAPKGNPSP